MQGTPPASKRLVPVCLFRASSLWLFSPGTPASFHKVKTDSDRYPDLFVFSVRFGKQTPLVFGEFFDRTLVWGVRC